MSAILVALAFLADAPASDRCVVTLRDLDAGEHVTLDAVRHVPCRGNNIPKEHVSFDRSTRSAIVPRSIPVGTYLGQLWPHKTPILPKGSRMTLRAMSGPAIVEREVVTLQPGRSGERIFVRDDNGNVFAASLHMDESAGREP